MTKPICLVAVNREISVNTVTLRDTLSKILDDYHVLVYPSIDKSIVDLDVKIFYEGNFTDIQYEELKKLITDKMKENVSGE